VNIDNFPSDKHLAITNNFAAGGYTSWYTYDSVFADRSGINGDYVVRYTSPQCPGYGALQRGQYAGTFTLASGGMVSIVIERGKNAPAQQSCPDCDKAGMIIGVRWSGIPIPGAVKTRTTVQGHYPVPAGPIDTWFDPTTFGWNQSTAVDLYGFSASGGLSSGNLCFPMCGSGLAGSVSTTGSEAIYAYTFSEMQGSYNQTGTISWTLT
jgi:hypothetical protein